MSHVLLIVVSIFPQAMDTVKAAPDYMVKVYNCEFRAQANLTPGVKPF